MRDARRLLRRVKPLRSKSAREGRLTALSKPTAVAAVGSGPAK
ncbi:hypothetical protein RMSM_04261 [Rhodopirellula maiorica SM1]|uniref:Uncharacterized protein n=1 Tax=Rhodopirellula maiorica SM1 TaxID=1265738 RepID=M5RHP4_9BACT|nr:hypothetical protein RMSM_04261 [Rhodopirellula maiorica SM1]